MQPDIEVLITAAITISFLHTLTGPDHYLPFIALSKSRGWSVARTITWTLICGFGHVWSSVLLGVGGAAIGWSLSKIKWLENIRGGIAGWVLLAFGVTYMIWGAIRAKQNKRHKHFDVYEDGSVYVYEHKEGEVVTPQQRHAVTPWIMFIIFILGPCEPMIPLLYFPAAKNSWQGMLILILVYTIFTLVTMLLMVLSGLYGFSLLKLEKLERHMHVLAGFTICICAVGMLFLGW